jgi:hypothetical protein
MYPKRQQSQFGILGVDERNLGGRIGIVQHMKNHHRALMKAKPNLNTRKRPMSHINKRAKPSGKGKQLIKHALEMEEVVQSFKKVAKMKKGYIDTKKPKTLKAKKLRKPGKFYNEKKFINTEHERNLKHLKRRMKRIGKSEKERKKNPYDPVAHPVRFFRRDPADPLMVGYPAEKMGINLDCLAGKLVNRRDVLRVNNSDLLKRGKKVLRFNELGVDDLGDFDEDDDYEDQERLERM